VLENVLSVQCACICLWTLNSGRQRVNYCDDRGMYGNVYQGLTAVSGFALTATKLMVFRSDVTLIFCRHRTNWQLLICFAWNLLLIQLQVVCLCVTRTLKLLSATS